MKTINENKTIKDVLKNLGYYTDWYLAGIPGGIPSAVQIHGKPIVPSGDVAAKINSRIQAAGDDIKFSGGVSLDNLRVVQLTAGIFNINYTDIIMNKPGVILRGMGKDTIIRGHTGGNGVIVIGAVPGYDSTRVFNLASGVKAGDDRITLETSSHGFTAGEILKLDRLADDAAAADGGSEWTNGHNQFMRGKLCCRLRKNYADEFGPVSPDGERPISQYIEIASVEGAVLFLSNRINIDFLLTGASGKALYPQVWNTQAHDYKYIGVENFKIETTAQNSDLGNWSWHLPVINIRIASSYCWVKNIESDGTKFDSQDRGFMGRHVELFGYRNHVTGGYFHHSSCVSPGGNGYGIRWHGTDCIIDNNICDMLNKPLLGQTSNGGNVIAYNYIPNAIITPLFEGNYPGAAAPDKPQMIDGWNETALDTSHGGYSHSDLFEGNYTANIHTDNISSNGWMTLFRNHSWGMNVRGSTSGSKNGIAIDGPQNEHASIGNVYLNSVTAINARIWDKPGDSGDGIVVYRFNPACMKGSGLDEEASRKYAFDRFYWLHDYNYVSYNLLSRNSADETIVLPDSLYLTQAPDYFKGYSWPPVNPFGTTDEERIGRLSAEDRYSKL
jgi:hypothetical protein